jgi:hypothetical protein
VRDVIRPQRCGERDRDEHQEQRPERERHLVAPQPPQREPVRTDRRGPLPLGGARERRCVERVLGCRLDGHRAPILETGSAYFFKQNSDQSFR